ncbi:hypothetical protein EVG20_g6900 [Dentipellis fragilis]|uniref:Integrase catalytic domain-containing protein n=1 Tax=Dentipellis fragilis TaxID=205917 RepID=A0A4Y9YH08_9AGAM|nr:hypothetical protein EVG20_g6900 [Dentipellis fragilis]
MSLVQSPSGPAGSLTGRISRRNSANSEKEKEKAGKAPSDYKPSGDAVAKLAMVHEPPPDPETTIRLFEVVERLSQRDDLLRKWLVDSGASRIMSSVCEWFSTYHEFDEPLALWLGDNSSINALGVGRIPIFMCAASETHKVILQDALYVPDLHGNLISVSHLTKRRARVQFLESSCQIFDQAGILTCEGHLEDNLYILDASTDAPETAYIATSLSAPSTPVSESVFAACTKVASADTKNKGMVKGMKIVGDKMKKAVEVCVPCLKGKQTREDIPKETEMCAVVILGHVYSDVCGPMQTQSCQGYKYFVSWIDNHSRRTAIDGMRAKSDVLPRLKEFIARVELKSGKPVHVLHMDGGGKYDSEKMHTFLRGRGIQHEMTTAETPKLNGISERFNCTVMEMGCSMLTDAGLPNTFWFDAVEYATYIHNVVPTHSLKGDVMPYKVWSGNKPNVALVRTFRCTVHVHIPKSRRRKLDVKSLECTFIGYAQNCKAYQLVHRPSGRIIESRDVVFDENMGPRERIHIDTEDDNDTEDADDDDRAEHDAYWSDDDDDDDSAPPSGDSGAGVGNPPGSSDTSEGGKDTSAEDGPGDEAPTEVDAPAPAEDPAVPEAPEAPAALQLCRSSRKAKLPVLDDDPCYKVNAYEPKTMPKPAGEDQSAYSACLPCRGDPRTYTEVMSCPEAPYWNALFQEEIDILCRRGIFKVVDRPGDRKVIQSKWVCKEKPTPDGESVDRLRSHVVTKGFTQIQGIDYDETFVPVMKYTSLRVVLALAASMDLELHQMDVKSQW